MEARDGSLESLSKTLSIRPHLFLECTVILSLLSGYWLLCVHRDLETDEDTGRQSKSHTGYATITDHNCVLNDVSHGHTVSVCQAVRLPDSRTLCVTYFKHTE